MPNSVPLVEDNLDFDVVPSIPGSKPREMARARDPEGNTAVFCQVAEFGAAGDGKRTQ